MAVVDRIKNAWNAFVANKDPTKTSEPVQYAFTDSYEGGYSYRPDRMRFTRGNEKSIVTSVYNRIALDAATVDIRHVRLDENNRFIEEMQSTLNECLSIDANTDQTGRALLQDIVQSMLDEGCVAIVPTDCENNPRIADNVGDIYTLRTGKVVEWYPSWVKIQLYNERNGRQQEIMLPKRSVAIVENPLYAVMNEPNSTLQRLIRKLCLLDKMDEQKGSNKLDLIIQLPYTIRTEARRAQAENRRKDIEMQLSSSKFGIAYTDATEHITQLNRSVDSQIQTQVEYLTNQLYGQLGIDATIMNGTANEETMTYYYKRTIEPILSAIVEEMRRKFLTKTARTQRQSIVFFRDTFKLVPTSKISDMANALLRNEILTANEFRQILGMKPAGDPKADELRNSNMPDLDGDGIPDVPEEPMTEEDYNTKMAELDEFDRQLDELEAMLKGGGEDDKSR
ncbi:MAG: phage portal protein [Pseudobutyrivibrio sp.]|nr:phage portal protein [Pseudobutyrivibrio sp.]